MKRNNTIQRQITKGYILLSGLLVLLVLLSAIFLSITNRSYGHIMAFQNQQSSSQQVISAHYKWLEQLSDSITTGTEFQGSLDPDGCALGQWMNRSREDLLKYPSIKAESDKIVQPHREIHLEASQLIETSRHDRDAAY